MHVYRLIGAGTVEEKIYARQIAKQGVLSGVCDDEQLLRSFSQAELDGLWSLTDAPPLPSAAELAAPMSRFAAAAEPWLSSVSGCASSMSLPATSAAKSSAPKRALDWNLERQSAREERSTVHTCGRMQPKEHA